MAAPLEGLKVLELARVLAGPWAGQMLGDLGASVIKVESPSGDDTRNWGPPFVKGGVGEPSAAYFHATNRGKRSIAIDFQTREGQDIVRKLAAGTDVLIENFKVGGLAKYGLDYASLNRINPRLIYCSITGFGQTGPYAQLPGYDFMIQGMGGLMAQTGEPDRPPQKVGLAVVDILCGVYSVVAIEAALIAREKTGAGQHIDMALLDTVTSVMSYHAASYLTSGISPGRVGNAHPNIVPYDEFTTKDGHLIIAVGNDSQFRHFVEVLGVPELADDPRFATNDARVTHRADLMPRLRTLTAGFLRDDLMARLKAANVPVGPINRVDQVFADPQVIARGMRLDLPDGGGAKIPSVRDPIVMDQTPLRYERASPARGEHTRAILSELGYARDTIDKLIATGVVSIAEGSA
jgi:crotonobetainyl-CoA:carnitine CoA-transferase CaiB-like acyl-CoA transferase